MLIVCVCVCQLQHATHLSTVWLLQGKLRHTTSLVTVPSTHVCTSCNSAVSSGVCNVLSLPDECYSAVRAHVRSACLLTFDILVRRIKPLQLGQHPRNARYRYLFIVLSWLSASVYTVQLCPCVQLWSKLSATVWFLMSDVGVDDQFDILCQYLGLPASLSVLFSQSDVLRQLVPRSGMLL